MTQRQTRRYPVNIPIRFRIKLSTKKLAGWHTGTLLNASTNGLFIRCDFPGQSGDTLEVELPLPALKFIVEAELKWHREDEPLGIGVQLAPIDEDAEDAIVSAIIGGLWFQPHGDDDAHEMLLTESDVLLDGLDIRKG